MKVVYITPDRALADSLKRQLAQLSPDTDLEIRSRVADARDLLASGAVEAVLTDTRLPDDDAPALLADIRRHALPFVIIVAPAAGVRGGFHWALRAGADDYVWSYAPGTFQSIVPPRFASDVAESLAAIERRRAESSEVESRLSTVYVGSDERVRELFANSPGIDLTWGNGMGSDTGVVAPDAPDVPAPPVAAAPALQDPRADALHDQQRRLLADEQARRDTVQHQLAEARSREAELTSTLASERDAARATLASALEASRATLVTDRESASAALRETAGRHEEALTRERSDREDLVRRLSEAQGERLKRLPLADVIRLTSTARRKGRLADFAISVVTELVSLFGNVAASAERAATAAPAGSPPRLHADETRRTAARARDVVHHLLLFSQSQGQPAKPLDLAQVMRDLRPSLLQVLGNNINLAVRVDPATAPVPLNHDPVTRLLLSAALLCRDALPIGGRVVFDVRPVDEVPKWAPSLPQSETLPFVRVTATVHGHALKPVDMAPSLADLLQECDGHAEAFATDEPEPSSGLHIYLLRAVAVSVE